MLEPFWVHLFMSQSHCIWVTEPSALNSTITVSLISLAFSLDVQVAIHFHVHSALFSVCSGCSVWTASVSEDVVVRFFGISVVVAPIVSDPISSIFIRFSSLVLNSFVCACSWIHVGTSSFFSDEIWRDELYFWYFEKELIFCQRGALPRWFYHPE